MNPFDLKSLLFAKHAQHVVLIHFPIALFLIGVGFDAIAQRTRNEALRATAYFNLIAAAIFTVPVLITGLLAWQWALGGAKLKGILLLHLVLACTASAMMWIAGWIQFRSKRLPERLPFYRLPLEFVGAALVAVTAHLGGFLSGVNLTN